MNPKKIGNTCGTEYNANEIESNHCKICDDDRQYVPEIGQTRTMHEELLKGRSVQNLFQTANQEFIQVLTKSLCTYANKTLPFLKG